MVSSRLSSHQRSFSRGKILDLHSMIPEPTAAYCLARPFHVPVYQEVQRINLDTGRAATHPSGGTSGAHHALTASAETGSRLVSSSSALAFSLHLLRSTYPLHCSTQLRYTPNRIP